MIEGISPQAMAFGAGVAAALGIIVFVPVLKIVLDIAEYSYANARISAMSGALIKKKRYTELVDAGNIEEFVGMLEGTPYSDFLGKMATGVDENSVEEAIGKEFVVEKDKIVSMLPQTAKRVIGVYFKKEEVHLLKKVLRGIASDVRSFDGLEPAGKISASRLTSVTEADTVKEFVARLEGTEYYAPINAAYPEYESTGNLIFIERAFDKYIMDSIWQRIAYAEMPLLLEFVGREIDIENIMISIRVKADGIKGTELAKYIINGGYEIREKGLKELIDAETVQDVVSLLEGTGYGKVLSEALPGYEEGGLSVFEDALRKFKYGLAANFAVQVLHIGPVLAYLIRKENEIINLKTIIKCKSIDMNKDKIGALVVA